MQPRKPDGSREPEPFSYFQLEQRRRAGPGEDKPAIHVSELPPQPRGSPWGPGPGPGREEFIDRSEDAATGGPTD
jgi:hypothetical protein